MRVEALALVAPTHMPHLPAAQVCLAAETCGHVGFSILGDTWYSAEPLHCTSERTQGGAGGVVGEVSYWELYRKVGAQCRPR